MIPVFVTDELYLLQISYTFSNLQKDYWDLEVIKTARQNKQTTNKKNTHTAHTQSFLQVDVEWHSRENMGYKPFPLDVDEW